MPGHSQLSVMPVVVTVLIKTPCPVCDEECAIGVELNGDLTADDALHMGMHLLGAALTEHVKCHARNN